MQVPTGLIVTFGRWANRRFGPVPVAASFHHHDLYEVSSISLAIVPQQTDFAADRGSFDRSVREGTSGFIVPTALVVNISNTDSSGVRPIYLTDLVLQTLDHTPLSLALLGKRGVVVRSIQAGGRGADGGFSVQFRFDRPKNLSLLKRAIANGYDGPRRMRIDPGRFAEVAVEPWPEMPGRYRMKVAVAVTDGRRRWTVKPKETITIYRLTGDVTQLPCWETDEFERSTVIDGEQFAAVNAEKMVMSPAPAPLIDDMQSRVQGHLNGEAT